jgi:protein O-GlcNAc transferase
MFPKLRDLLKSKPARAARGAGSGNVEAVGAAAAATAEELFERALGLQQRGELEPAIELYGAVIERSPERAEAYYKRANALNGLGRLEAALEDYDRAIGLNPSYAYALCNRGSVLERLGRREEALGSYDRALELDPKDALTHYNRGSVLKDLKRFEEALGSYERAIGLNGDYAEAYVNRGSVLQDLKRHEAAVESFDRAIALNPMFPEAFQGRGLSLCILSRRREALDDFNKAIALRPDSARAYINRANLLADVDRHDAAITDYLKATELDPQDVEGFQSMGGALARLKRLDLAIASFDKAMSLKPDAVYLVGARCEAKMHACRWDDLREDLDRVAEGVTEGKCVCTPLAFAAMVDSPALQRSAAQIFVRDQIHGSVMKDADRERAAVESGLRSESGKIRIGYFSSDFRMHPVGLLSAGLFEHHDRSRFELTAFAFGPEGKDAMQERMAKVFDRFIDVRQKSDREVVELARDLGIDIAVDMNGFTAHCRSRIFASRAAPVQVNFLGYPGTMGADFMDYLIADATVVPREQQAHYAEKIVYLPDSFLPFDSSYAIAERNFTREELGLPSAGFVFCCFNNSHKITPQVFDRWMRILSGTEGSVLWLSRAEATAAGNLRKEASRRGVDEGRLVFASRMDSLPEHLARLRAADLFLDTFPYNAHATAMDALWAGIPLLTYPGESFPSRVAASLLRTAGVPELIAASPSDYEAKALQLAAQPQHCAQLKRRLAQRATVLFDTQRYTRNLEAAYQMIYERHRRGQPPDHINQHPADPGSGVGHGG